MLWILTHTHKLYTTDYNSNTVSVIDTTTNTVIDTIPVGNNPDAIEINTSNNNVYVANHRSNTISVIGLSTTEPPQPPEEEEEPKTITDLLKGIIQNPLDIANSINSANQIRDILTDNKPNNDELVCDLKSENDFASNIREILKC